MRGKDIYICHMIMNNKIVFQLEVIWGQTTIWFVSCICIVIKPVIFMQVIIYLLE